MKEFDPFELTDDMIDKARTITVDVFSELCIFKGFANVPDSLKIDTKEQRELLKKYKHKFFITETDLRDIKIKKRQNIDL